MRAGDFLTPTGEPLTHSGSRIELGQPLPAWRHCQIPQLKGSVPPDCSPPPTCHSDVSHKPGRQLCLTPTSYKSEVPKTSFSGSINVPEQLTEFTEALYSVDDWFILKAYNSGAARRMRCRGLELPGELQSRQISRVRQPGSSPNLSLWVLWRPHY